MTPHGIKIA